MQIPSPTPSSVWVPISGIASIICAVFAVLGWAEIKPESSLSWKLKPPKKPAGPAWLAWLTGLSIALAGSSLFMATAPLHPVLATRPMGSVERS